MPEPDNPALAFVQHAHHTLTRTLDQLMARAQATGLPPTVMLDVAVSMQILAAAMARGAALTQDIALERLERHMLEQVRGILRDADTPLDADGKPTLGDPAFATFGKWRRSGNA